MTSTPSAPDYGRSLSGFGVNIIVRDVARAVGFAKDVLGAQVAFQKDGFAAMILDGTAFMFHGDATYRHNILTGSLASAEARGVGIELRCYSVDPDAAEKRARTLGLTVLAGSMDKPHGLRECVIMDEEGYIWIPSRPLAKATDGKT